MHRIIMETDDSKKIEHLESQIQNLSQRYEDSHRFFKHILSAITIIFIFISIIITVLSISSRNEIDDAIKEMERKFEILSGQALREPKIDIYFQDNLITNRTISIKTASTNWINVDSLYLKNNGDKIAKEISIKFYLSQGIGYVQTYTQKGRYFGTGWQVYNSPDKNYPGLCVYEEKLSLNSGDSWAIPGIQIQREPNEAINMLNSKIEVFYNVDKTIAFLDIELNK